MASSDARSSRTLSQMNSTRRSWRGGKGVQDLAVEDERAVHGGMRGERRMQCSMIVGAKVAAEPHQGAAAGAIGGKKDVWQGVETVKYRQA